MSGIDDVVVTELDDDAPAVVEEVPAHAALPAGLSENDDGTYTLALARPVVIAFKNSAGVTREERFESLILRRLTGRDMKAMMISDRRDGAMALLEAAIEAKPGRAPMITDRMDAADLMAGLKVVGFLSGNGPMTGP